MHRIVIGFTGRIGSGKSTAAAHVEKKWGFQRVRFAGALKQMMRCIGLTDEEIEGHLKETPCKLLCGKTPRFAMQTIGNEWGREMIGQDIWLNVWRRAVQNAEPGLIVVEDVRYENEAQAIRELGGVVIRLWQPGYVKSHHISERGDFPVEHTVGATSVPMLHELVEEIVGQYVRQAAIDRSWAEAALEGGSLPPMAEQHIVPLSSEALSQMREKGE